MLVNIYEPQYVLAKNGQIKISSVEKDLLITEYDEIFPLLTVLWNSVVANSQVDTGVYKSLAFDSNYFTYIFDNINEINGWQLPDSSKLYFGFIVIRNFTGKVLKLQLELDPYIDWNTFALGVCAGNLNQDGSITWHNPLNDSDKINFYGLMDAILPYKDGRLQSTVYQSQINASLNNLLGQWATQSTPIPKVYWQKFAYQSLNWVGKKYISGFEPKRVQYLIFNSDNTVSVLFGKEGDLSQVMDYFSSSQDEDIKNYDFILLYYTTKTGAVNGVPELLNHVNKIYLRTAVPFIVSKNTNRQFYFSNVFESTTEHGVKTKSVAQNKIYAGINCVAYTETTPTPSSNWVRIYTQRFSEPQKICALLVKNLVTNDDLDLGSPVLPEFAVALNLAPTEVERVEGDEGCCEWLGNFPDVLETYNGVEIQPFFKFTAPVHGLFYVNLIDRLINTTLKDFLSSNPNENLSIKELRIYINRKWLRRRPNNKYYGGIERLEIVEAEDVLTNNYSVIRTKPEPIYSKLVINEQTAFVTSGVEVSFGDNSEASFSIPLENSKDLEVVKNSPFFDFNKSNIADVLKVGNECKIAVGNNVLFRGVISSLNLSSNSKISVTASSLKAKLNKYITEPYPTIIYKQGTPLLTVLKDLMYLAGFVSDEFDFDTSMLAADAEHQIEQDISFYGTTFEDALKSILDVIGYAIVQDTSGLIKLKKLSWFYPFSAIKFKAKPFTNNVLSISFSISNENLRDIITIRFENDRMICSAKPLELSNRVIEIPSLANKIIQITGLHNPANVGWASKVYEKKLTQIESSTAVEMLLGYLLASMFELRIELDGIEPVRIGEFKAVTDPSTGISVVGAISEVLYNLTTRKTSVKLETLLTPVNENDTSTIDFYVGGPF